MDRSAAMRIFAGQRKDSDTHLLQPRSLRSKTSPPRASCRCGTMSNKSRWDFAYFVATVYNELTEIQHCTARLKPRALRVHYYYYYYYATSIRIIDRDRRSEMRRPDKPRGFITRGFPRGVRRVCCDEAFASTYFRAPDAITLQTIEWNKSSERNRRRRQR